MKKLCYLLLPLLFVVCKPKEDKAPFSTLVIQHSELASFAAKSGQEIPSSCKVTVFDRSTGEVKQGIKVAYKVMDGPVVLGDGNGREVVVQTDAAGTASVTISFPEQGASTLVAEIAENPDQRVLFLGYTEARSHRIFVKTTPCISVEPGIILATIRVNDHLGNPVENADLTIAGSSEDYPDLFGTIRKIGAGLYEGKLQTTQAGEWTVSIQDKTTRAVEYTVVHILPGKATGLRLIDPVDPRLDAPYDQAILRAQLVDRFNNILDPSSITCLVNGRSVAPMTTTNVESRFAVTSVGYSNVNVVLKDGVSGISTELVVPFVAAWIEDPGYIRVGEKYTTKVYMQPEPGREVNKATVSVRFDGELVSFEKFTPAENASFPMQTQARVDGNILVMELSSEKMITANNFSQGVYIGEIDWECTGEGSTCFGVAIAMSPQTDWWEMCPRQKRQVPKCVCVNVIHRAGNNAARIAGRDAMNFMGAFNEEDNLEECCPFITAQVHYTAVPAVDWDAAVTPAVGANDGVINTPGEYNDFLRQGSPNEVTIGQRNNCLNFYMTPVDVRATNSNARTRIGPSQDGNNRGVGIINPGSVAQVGTLGAHEVAHALGLRHNTAGGDSDNLLFTPRRQATGNELTEDQCRTIMSTIDSVACQ